jgi:putative oxidoreductase
MSARFSSYAPIMLSVLRIIAALIFLEHGTQKILGFPPGGPDPLPHMMTTLWWAGMIEMIPGFLLVIGLYTRTAAFLAAGEMAFAYWIGHFPRAFWPVDNGGDAAILYCFIFLYILCAGPGPWSVDAKLVARRTPAPEDD